MADSNHEVVIIGAGFSGLGMAIRLKRAGLDDFVLLEKAERVGGTWRDNQYPGAACDVESHLYSLSFEPNPGWTRTFAPQGEILAYLERCVENNGLAPHLRLGQGVRAVAYDDASTTWCVETHTGETLRARLLIACCGPLTTPASPDIPGLSSFAGRMFHSARWDPSYPFEGKRVGVIGTGASSIQIVPQLAPRVGQLHLFQRTPPWILPKPDEPISEEHRSRLQRSPWRQAMERRSQFWKHELTTLAFINGRDSRLLRMGARLAQRHLQESVPSPELQAKLRPDYQMGCKRVLLSNDYYPALTRENVEVVTDAIVSIGPQGVHTADGRLRELDALVLATGFQASDPVAPFEIRGRGGVGLDEAWRSGAEAYLGTAVVGFPNLFLIVGPNTGLGSTSMILMIEAQLTYVLSCLQAMHAQQIRSVEVLPEVQQRFNDELRGRLGNSVWASGCKAWYTNRAGRNTTLWPGTTLEFRWRTRRFDAEAYTCVIDEGVPAGQ